MSVTTDEPVDAEEVSSEPFHIVCSAESSDPTVKVGWCIENDTIKKFLKVKSILRPYMLVVATQNGYEYDRRIAPLEHGFLRMAFRRAGKFTLHATVVYNEGDKVHDLKRILQARDSDGIYRTNCWSEVGKRVHAKFYRTISEEKVEVLRHNYVATHNLIVEDGHFAKEPAEWRKKLVGLFFEKKGRDECNWRRRWLMSLLFFVVYLPIQYLLKSIGVVFCGITGMVYGLDMKYYLPPGRHGSILDLFGDVEKYPFWWFKWNKTDPYQVEFIPRNTWWNCLTIAPLIYSVISLIIAIDPDVSIANAFMWVGIWGGGIALVFASFIGFMVWWDDRKPERRNNRQLRREAREDARRKKLEKRNVVAQLDELSCRNSGEPMTIERLMERRKYNPTVLYHKAKDEVCRPFQQG